MYYLMNKDTITASISRKDGRWKLLHQNAILPAGKFEINEWLEDRKAFKHNHHLKRLMEDCGCETTEGFIRITHAASINDSYWLKKDGEEISWDDVSFYRNDFNDTVSKLAFEGLGLYGIQMSSTSPELTTDGSFRKCWRKEYGNIYLYKRGTSGAYNAGLEPYCEALASEIINHADPWSVRYTVVKLHKETATKCRSFTNEETGFVPLRKLVDKNITMDGLLQFFDRLGCLEKFQRMLVLDAITFNVDRHLGNIGVLVDNDTQKIAGIAPNFDFNLSMLPYVTKEEFDDIGRKLLDYGPQIGNDFTRMGQQMLTSEIRSELISLQGFEFTFRGNQDFEPWRVQKLEEMVHQQIKAVLKGERLQTKDVFVPKTDVQQDWFFDNAKELKISALLKDKLNSMHVFSSVMEEIGEDNHVSVRATVHEREDFIDIIINMDTMEISCEKNGIEMPEENISAGLDMFHNLYMDICIVTDTLYEDSI
ncbi:MAG: hypothetical protein K1W24_12065 [Lachnospiraceae bacterium]|jgi:hypothetical protein